MTKGSVGVVAQTRFAHQGHDLLAEKGQFIGVIHEGEGRTGEPASMDLDELIYDMHRRADQRKAPGPGCKTLPILGERTVVVTVAEALLLLHVIVERGFVGVFHGIAMVVILRLLISLATHHMRYRVHANIASGRLSTATNIRDMFAAGVEF